MTNVPFLLKKIDSLHWNAGDTLPLESSAAVLVPPLPMPCSLPRVWFCEWIRESTPCCTTCNISLCAFETQIPPHFTSCILIERLGSVLSWIANRWQSTSSDGVQVKSAEKDSDFKLENIILSENCTRHRASDLSPRHERFIFNYTSELNVRCPEGDSDLLNWSSTCFNISCHRMTFCDPLSWGPTLASIGILGPLVLLKILPNGLGKHTNDFLSGGPVECRKGWWALGNIVNISLGPTSPCYLILSTIQKQNITPVFNTMLVVNN